MATPKEKLINFYGRMMSAREIKAWVDENCDYTIAVSTILDRHSRGFTDGDLIERPITRNQETRRLPPQPLCRVSVPGWGFRVQRR